MIQKTAEATGDFIGNRIADKIIKLQMFQKNFQQSCNHKK